MLNTTPKQCGSTKTVPFTAIKSKSGEGIEVWPDLTKIDLGTPTQLDLEGAKILLSRSCDKAILPFLALLGTHFRADRAWCVDYSPDLSRFYDTFEWCVSGVITHNVDNLPIPSTTLGAMHDLMKKGHPVTIFDVCAMPRTMRALQTKLNLQSTLSSIGIPVFYNDRLRGIIGLDMTTASTRWDTQAIQQLCRLTELYGLSYFSERNNTSQQNADNRTKDENYVYFQGTRAIVGANLHDITTCNAEKDNTRIFLKNGSNILDSRGLKWWETVLPESYFLRIHRSTIVKLSAVQEIKRAPTGQWQAFIKDQAPPLNISRTKVTLLRNRLGC